MRTHARTCSLRTFCVYFFPKLLFQIELGRSFCNKVTNQISSETRTTVTTPSFSRCRLKGAVTALHRGSVAPLLPTNTTRTMVAHTYTKTHTHVKSECVRSRACNAQHLPLSRLERHWRSPKLRLGWLFPSWPLARPLALLTCPGETALPLESGHQCALSKVRNLVVIKLRTSLSCKSDSQRGPCRPEEAWRSLGGKCKRLRGNNVRGTPTPAGGVLDHTSPLTELWATTAAIWSGILGLWKGFQYGYSSDLIDNIYTYNEAGQRLRSVKNMKSKDSKVVWWYKWNALPSSSTNVPLWGSAIQFMVLYGLGVFLPDLVVPLCNPWLITITRVTSNLKHTWPTHNI